MRQARLRTVMRLQDTAEIIVDDPNSILSAR